MGIEQVYGLPGIRAPRTAAYRTILRQGDFTYLAQGRVIKGSLSADPLNVGDERVLRPGLLMGKITATGLYAPSILGVVGTAYTSGGTTLTVSAATAVELARRIGSSGTATVRAIGPPTAAGTVAVTSVTYSAVNQATGDVTVTSLGVDKVAGTFITAADGSQLPLTLIPDGYGIKVTDQDGTSVDVEFPRVPIAGVIDASQIINWPSDTSLQSWIIANLNGPAGGQFVLDQIY